MFSHKNTDKYYKKVKKKKPLLHNTHTHTQLKKHKRSLNCLFGQNTHIYLWVQTQSHFQVHHKLSALTVEFLTCALPPVTGPHYNHFQLSLTVI